MSLDATIQMFFEEAADLLRDFETGLLRLEQSPHDPDVLHAVFRSAHTLKGTSGMLGFEAIARFTHALEDLLARLRKRELAATPAMVTALLASADVLRMLIERARAGEAVDAGRLDEMIAALTAHARGGADAPRPAADHAVEVYVVTFVPPTDLLARGLDPVRLLDALEQLGEVTAVTPDLSRLPPLAELNPETAYLGFTCTLRSARPRAAVESVFEFVGDPEAVRIGTPEAPPPAAAPAPVARPESAPPGAWSGRERRSGLDRRAVEPA
ncbi:MAG TPA: Hpt domain-containing protein, partial [Methylomirabilota bacterium]|nr:Hpt domain-containing protein [Methylomirabilota bacterium]